MNYRRTLREPAVAVERLVVAQRQDGEPTNHELFIRIQRPTFAAFRDGRGHVWLVVFSP
jgi:hypothetical protein